ncbi:Nif3-like dinuclear metal center hexameric protein [Peptoniphilus sp. GNH]|nr:Nif3-like dinuclear metal center hexameric protein [Peptoniphilus sp. GNH]
MPKISDILNYLESFANPSYQEDWDNSGCQIVFDKICKGILLCMDVKDVDIDFALENDINLIISHHPFLFKAIKEINASSYKGKIIEKAIKNDISIYSSHTALDLSQDGVTKAMALRLGIKDYSGLSEGEKGYYGGYGRLEMPCSFDSLIDLVKAAFNPDFIKVYGRSKNEFKNIAWCGGAGSDFVLDAIQKSADAYITGDISYHFGQTAYENNLCLIDIGHFSSEFPVLEHLKKKIESKFELPIHISKNNLFLLNNF